MRRIKEKLKSRSGASMIISLVFFLICTVICTVVITSARTGAGRIESEKEMDKAYLSVSSACGVLRKEFSSAVFSKIQTEISDSLGTDSASENEEITEGDFSEILFEMCKSGSLKKNCEATFSGDNLDVQALIEVDSEYNITVKLDTVNEGDANCPITVFFKSEKNQKIETEVKTQPYTDSNGEDSINEIKTVKTINYISWDSGTVSKGGE